MQDYKRDTWKNTDVVFLAPAYLPDPPPRTLITAQALPHLLSFLKSSSSQPQECQAILSGSSASPLLLSHVRMCHLTELCRYMLGGFSSVSVPGVHTNGLRTKQGVLCTSLYQRPFYCFYTKIFLLRSLFIIVLTNVNYKRYQWGKKFHILIHQQYYFK